MAKMAFFLDLEAWPCLVSGGGSLAAEAGRRLLSAGALLSCWSRDFIADFADMERSFGRENLSFVRGELNPQLLRHLLKQNKGPRLVVLASGNDALDAELFAVCEEFEIPAACPGKRARLSLGSTVQRGALSFGVGAELLPELEDAWYRRLERSVPRAFESGATALARELHSQEMQKMHPEIRARRASEWTTALMDTEGDWEGAVLRMDRKKNPLS